MMSTDQQSHIMAIKQLVMIGSKNYY